jgi:hypothetical protein
LPAHFGQVLAKEGPYLSPETEHSEEPSTLPPPELNPLLNPLLAENMGRWAQVYFTSLPEKRDEAVHELLRALEMEKSIRAETGAAAVPSDAPPSSATSSITEATREPVSPSASHESEGQPTLVRCHACGRKNPSSQRFCGLCGTRLGEEQAVADLPREDLRHQDIQTARLQFEEQHIQNSPQQQAAAVRSNESRFVPLDEDVYPARLNTNELSLFQSSRDIDYSDEDPETSRGSGSYRTYAATVLVILVGTLAYVAWRNAQVSSQSSHSKPPVSFAAPEEPVSSEPVAPSPSKTDRAAPVPPADHRAGSARHAAEAVRERPDPAKPVRKAASNTAGTATEAALRAAPNPEKNSQAERLAGSGADELALAQGYLNGTKGQGRNGAEAAKWLWRAIAKHNAEATFLLSDMYLKGDGVSKSCDQARVLLDAATLKGVKGAGERLRHLQAFGCP